MLTTVLGAVGAGLGLVRAVPQLLRLIRTQDSRGVSLDALVTSAVVSLGWAVYGLLTRQLVVSLATGASAVVFLMTSAAGLAHGRSLRDLRVAPVWACGLLLVTVLAGATGLGFALPASVLAANLPQLVGLVRDTAAPGLSRGTWRLFLADGTVWTLYAVVSGDVPIAVYGVLQMASSAAILRRMHAAQRRSDQAARAPASRIGSGTAGSLALPKKSLGSASRKTLCQADASCLGNDPLT
jgi:uncharacterized protein with PQ loop repeat